MCGIVAVLRRRSHRPVPEVGRLLGDVEAAASLLEARDLSRLDEAATLLESVDSALRGTAGLQCLLGRPGGENVAALSVPVEATCAWLEGIESDLDAGRLDPGPDRLEAGNAAVLRCKDAWWALERDRLGAARAVAGLVGAGIDPAELGPAAIDGLWAIQVALASLDRLEVRGRDSAGVHVLVAGHGLDLEGREMRASLGERAADPLFASLAVRTPPGCLSLVYKAAAEIGDLGDNVAALRAAIRTDALLALALSSPSAQVTVIGHTRWASVGIISQANAHPVNSDELGRPDAPYVVAALNGDVDNHAALRISEALSLPTEVTTDAKVVPALVSRRLAGGATMADAFASSARRFDGSVAVAASGAGTPDEVHLALRGSGQSLYVGLAEDAFVVASEPYGLVEETAAYVRMDGEATQGQLVVLHRQGAGTLGGMERRRYDGGPLPVGPADVTVAGITTRDIDRASFPHFLLKEISESPASFSKTLRGRLVTDAAGRLGVRLSDSELPPAVRAAVRSGAVSRVVVIGQGTAAVAGQAVAAAVARCLPGLLVSSVPATELSGFGLSDDMAGTLVVAISQSGTTTDTNRTVDLVRSRGAHVVAVVNRRHSDLTAKAHGVLYTSDGRDVEMSVASTKAFYAQVAAGWLLAAGLASATGGTAADRDGIHGVLRSLRDLPAAMERVLAMREHIGRVAAAVAPPRRSWAVVGSGNDRVAASEVRIKLSELCYKSIACDVTEDKKHIDLSSEPLIIVCAAGLSGSNADDVAKEVAIYRAHKAVPVVIVAEGESARFADAAVEVIEVPACDPALAFVLSAMAGHLFGYEAALAIDGQARPLREARAAVEASEGGASLDRLAPALAKAVEPFLAGVRAGAYNGSLEAGTAVRLVSLLRYATGVFPIEGYELESGKVGAPSALVADLLDALTAGIGELTRPVDAIKHQAKTVTVGISRSEDDLFTRTLVKETLAAGATPDILGYRALRTLAALDESVEEVAGYTRYRIDWHAQPPTAAVLDQGGLASGLPPSRTATDPRLRGTKHRAADEREVTVARGASDGRTVVLVPEVKGPDVTGMTLLHVRFHDFLTPEAAARVLSGYRSRYSALADAVTETEPVFDEARLGDVAIVELLTEPVYVLARRWRPAP